MKTQESSEYKYSEPLLGLGEEGASGKPRHINKLCATSILSINFFVIFGCFTGGSTMTAYLYGEAGLGFLAQKSQGFIYMFFFFANFFSRAFVGYFKELRFCLMVGCIVYSLFMIAGAATFYCKNHGQSSGICEDVYLEWLNYIAAALLGFIGPVLVWNGQFRFLDRLAAKSEKKKIFGFFVMLLQFNYVFGSTLNFIYFSLESNPLIYYFLYMVVTVVCSLLIGFCLPNLQGYDAELDKMKEDTKTEQIKSSESGSSSTVERETDSKALKRDDSQGFEEDQEQETEEEQDPNTEEPASTNLVENWKRLWRTFKLKKFMVIYPILVQMGLGLGYVLGSMYRLLFVVYPKDSDLVKDHEHFYQKAISLLIIWYGCSSIVSSFVLKYVDKKYNKVLMKIASVVQTLLLGFTTILGEHIKYIWILALCAWLLGTLEVVFNTMINVYLSSKLKGTLEAVTIWRMFVSSCATAFFFLFSGFEASLTFGYILTGVQICLSLLFLAFF